MTHAALEAMGDLVATAVKGVITADNAFPFPVYGPRAFSAMNVNRVEVVASGFGRASDHMGITANAVPYYAHREGNLDISVVTARTDQQNTDNHSYAVGRIRYLMSRPAQKLTANVMSNLQVVDVYDLGATQTIEEDVDLDRTTLNFKLELHIPPAVYAALT